MIRLSPVAGAGGLHEREDGGIIANGGHEGIAAEDWIDGNQPASGFAVLVNGLGCLLPCSRVTPVRPTREKKIDKNIYK